MQEINLKVLIKRPISDVFAFAINPKNTPKWLPSISIEETNEWPIKLGSVYRNKNRSGKWSTFTVTELKENSIFALTNNDNNNLVKYIFTKIDTNTTELEYLISVNEGNFESSFIQDLLNKLKSIMES